MEKLKNVLIGVLVIGLLGVGASLITDGFQKMPQFLKSNGSQEVAQKAIDHIKENLLQEGTKAELKEVSQSHGLYKMKLEIGGDEITSHATKDGKMLFPEAIELTSATDTASEGETNNETKAEIPKKEEAKVELFVMSFCPYGNQAEQTMEPVYELLGDKVDWNIHYIVSEQDGKLSSLHGQTEVDQNARELCVLKNQGLEKWFGFANYVNENCGSEGKCWQEAAKDNDLDPEKITSCKDESGNEMQKEEAQIAKEKGAQGSPTLLINGVESKAVYQYGKPNTYKEAICSGFENPPAECEEKLEATGNSQSDGGSC